jgi:hypothetical protein
MGRDLAPCRPGARIARQPRAPKAGSGLRYRQRRVCIAALTRGLVPDVAIDTDDRIGIELLPPAMIAQRPTCLLERDQRVDVKARRLPQRSSGRSEI